MNAIAGLAGGIVSGALDPCQNITPGFLASSAAFGALGGIVGGWAFPTIGMSNFNQIGFPRTWSGVIPRLLGGAAGPNALNGIYVGGTVATAAGFAGPVYVQ